MTKNQRDDRAHYRTVQCWDVRGECWRDNARRVRPAKAEAIRASLEQFGHKARIVGNIYYAGIFGPQEEPR